MARRCPRLPAAAPLAYHSSSRRAKTRGCFLLKPPTSKTPCSGHVGLRRKHGVSFFLMFAGWGTTVSRLGVPPRFVRISLFTWVPAQNNGLVGPIDGGQAGRCLAYSC